MVLTAACCWPSSHYIYSQEFVTVSTAFNHNRSRRVLASYKGVQPPLLLIACMNWMDIHSPVNDNVTDGTCGINLAFCGQFVAVYIL